MRSNGSLAIGSPGVLVVVAPVIAVTAAGLALLLGLPVWGALLCGLLVVWTLAVLGGLVLLAALRRVEEPVVRRLPAPRRPVGIDLRYYEIDLRDKTLERRLPHTRSEPSLDLPRQKTGKGRRAAP